MVKYVKMKTGGQFKLPKRIKKSLIEYINDLGRWQLVCCGLVLYVATVLVFSIIEYCSDPGTNLTVKTSSFLDIVYFNFISILTIGYGDLSPKGVFRLYTIIEAMAGLAIYSLMVSIMTIKLLLPRRNTIIFSKYAYYCTEDNSFMVIYLNTATQNMTNVESLWYFKLQQDWKPAPATKVPFITRAVQTFYLGFKPLEQFLPGLHPLDCLRFSISGNVGLAGYSTYVQYNLNEILVIPNRNKLTNYPGFYQVDEYIGKPEFQDHFHYKPEGAVFLSEKLRR